QALAGHHANEFILRGTTNTFLTTLNDISLLVLHLLQPNVALAKRLDSGKATKADFDKFKESIGQLMMATTDPDQDSGSILSILAGDLVGITELDGQIDDDRVRLVTALRTVKSTNKISKLEAGQVALQQKLSKLNDQIAEGATDSVLDDVTFGFSFGLTFLGGISTGSVAGGTLAIVGEAKQIMQYNQSKVKLYDDQKAISDQIVQLVDEITKDKEELLTLTLATAQLKIFYENQHALSQLAAGMVSTFERWKSGLRILSETNTPPSDHFFEQQIKSGLDYWKEVRTKTAKYLSTITQGNALS
ncbi:MAG: hypothetical protein AAF570_05490, partial [Bacteroidota bacterium]